jgi:hypothetical protein
MKRFVVLTVIPVLAILVGCSQVATDTSNEDALGKESSEQEETSSSAESDSTNEETQAQTEKDIYYSSIVADAGVNVRSEPTALYDNKIFYIEAGDSYTLLKSLHEGRQVSENDETHVWYKVLLPDGTTEGWIRSDLVGISEYTPETASEAKQAEEEYENYEVGGYASYALLGEFEYETEAWRNTRWVDMSGGVGEGVTRNINMRNIIRDPNSYSQSPYAFVGNVRSIRREGYAVQFLLDASDSFYLLNSQDSTIIDCFYAWDDMPMTTGDQITVYGFPSGRSSYTTTNTYGQQKTIETFELSVDYYQLGAIKDDYSITNEEKAYYFDQTYIKYYDDYVLSQKDSEEQVVLTENTINNVPYTMESVTKSCDGSITVHVSFPGYGTEANWNGVQGNGHFVVYPDGRLITNYLGAPGLDFECDANYINTKYARY